MIRIATIDDLDTLVEMSGVFFAETNYAKQYEYHPESMAITLTPLIEAQTVFTDGKDCAIVMVLFPSFFNHEVIVAQELGWYVSKGKRKSGLGIKLLRHAEEEMKKRGAKLIIMLSLGSNDISLLYEKLGYTEQERIFMRKP